ncbi:hypothetical protein BS78_03G094900 [Paspalum vaginatum]|nr:hypothetical protein BS78_03G094900 [Paspalum vaginatum]
MGDQQQPQPEGVMRVGGLQMPPGFRFYPSDEEIITFYLTPKVLQSSFTCTAIAEVDLNKTEPWDLPGKAKIGEKEWYFFSQKDRKYPTGMRANRATEAGYWKATGKDKEIYRAAPGVGMMPLLIGMKKTLVFYMGRAPRGDKTNWVMHEYRLEGSGKLPCSKSSSTSNTTMTSGSKDEWVVCRVFHKTTGVKKSPPSYLISMAGGEMIDQSSIAMPMPVQFSILPDFVSTNPAGSYYFTTGVNSSSVPPVMPPIAGMESVGLQMNAALFQNPNAPPPMPFYHQHQMDAGAAGAGSFMAAPESGPSSMVSQEAGMSPELANSVEISSMVSATPACAASMDMDGIWTEVLKE